MTEIERLERRHLYIDTVQKIQIRIGFGEVADYNAIGREFDKTFPKANPVPLQTEYFWVVVDSAGRRRGPLYATFKSAEESSDVNTRLVEARLDEIVTW
ncbi:MAG: hypothetical protein E4H01_10385 [Lysobacterales bacterium]|nr:MAG: hypothetical protein E4H01_10385 [Xanthomonadales bacterium]